MSKGFSKTESIIIISLIFIAIIVVVTFLIGGFKSGATDIKIRDGLRTLRKESEIFYLANNKNYKGFCSSLPAQQIKSKLENINCFDTHLIGDHGSWAAESNLIEDFKYYCVDYKGQEGFATSSTISFDDFSCNLVD